MDVNALKEALKEIPLGGLRSFNSIGSTNDEALAWVDAAGLDFSLVIADEQTRGRGRFQRHWITRSGSSLAFSLIIKPAEAEREHLSLFAPLCGVAIWQVLQEQYDIQAEIKWPNDILIQRQKCAGILVEAAWTGTQLSGVVLGVGINISHDSIPPQKDQMFPATCLQDALGYPVDRFALLAEVLQSIRHWRPLLGDPQMINAWQTHLAFMGEQVSIVQTPKPSIIGVIRGIDRQGNLILCQSDNREVRIEVGDVHLRPGDKIRQTRRVNNAG